MMCDLVMFLNVGKNMSDTQIIQTVELILEDYGHFKPEDFKLCFNRMKKGFYGPLYDRFDGQLILSVLKQYDNERDGDIEQIHQNVTRQSRKPVVLTQTEQEKIAADDTYKRNMDKLKNDMAERMREKRNAAEANATKTPDTDPVKQLHLKWIEQFNQIWIRQGAKGGTKFIRRYGNVKNPKYFPGSDEPQKIPKMLDITAYLWYKQRQYQAIVIEGKRHYKPKQ